MTTDKIARKKKIYSLLYAANDKEFDEMVSDHLNDGWELYGNPFVLDHPGYSAIVFHYQAVVKNVSSHT